MSSMVAFITSPIDTLLQGATRARAPSRTFTVVPTLPCKPNSRFDLRETKLAPNTRWGSRSRDPIGYVDGLNLKTFTSGSPTTFTDPFGFATAPPVPESNCSPPKNQGANHIAGRGNFGSLWGGDPFSKYTTQEMKENFGYRDGDINPMLVYATWIADPAKFKDKAGNSQKCCCCDEIGYAQIIKSKMEYSGSGFLSEDHDWKFDSRPGSIHYPRVEVGVATTTNPCAEKAVPIEFLDLPARSDSWTQRVTYWKFEAETCVVCLAGKEGPSQNLKKISTYDCFKWSFVFERNKKGYTEQVRRGPTRTIPTQSHWIKATNSL